MGVFIFKQFTVCDDGSAMKVGTDAVLLGAWANVENVSRVLDIGTGSGIIALMLAQRTKDHVHIDAVELVTEDSRQASENVSQSPWSNRISVYNTSIQKFDPGLQYDCIVCNPPYFSRSLQPPLHSRQTSRHDATLSQDDLLDSVFRLLTKEGHFHAILPAAESKILEDKAKSRNIFLHRRTRFFTRFEKAQERTLMEFQFTPAETLENNLILYSSGSQRSDEYQKLTREFYPAC